MKIGGFYMSWKNKPSEINKIEPSNPTELILYLDESGSSEMKRIHQLISLDQIISTDDKYFTLTSVAIQRSKHNEISDEILNLKKKHWGDGFYIHITKTKCEKRRICFHSYDIRKSRGPFRHSVLKDYDGFIVDLTEILGKLDVKIFSISINKEELYKRQPTSRNVYEMAVTLLIEQIGNYIDDKKITVVVESRGKNENSQLHKHFVGLVDSDKGKVMFDFIQGVHFNQKWNGSDKLKTYIGLELADLFCYPIATFAKTGEKSRPFLAIESKLCGYPNYEGKGLI